MITHGLTMTFGTATYSVTGCSSKEEAASRVFRMAYECGDYKPTLLLEKWWQFWRQIEHSELDEWLLSQGETE